MATAEELEERLTELDDAIQYVATNGQSRTVRGRSVTYPPLKDMQEQRNILAARLNGRRSTITLIRRRRG